MKELACRLNKSSEEKMLVRIIDSMRKNDQVQQNAERAGKTFSYRYFVMKNEENKNEKPNKEEKTQNLSGLTK